MKKCESCGQRIRKLNPHSMDKNKVEVLRDIAKINAKGHEWVKVQRDPRLITRDDWDFTIQVDCVHVLRLYWFGLLDRKEHRDGLYKITWLGKQFLCGYASVPEKIYCRDGQVVDQTQKQVSINMVRGVVYDKAYWDSYWFQQRLTAPKDQAELFPKKYGMEGML